MKEILQCPQRHCKLSGEEKLRPLCYPLHDVGNIVEINELRRVKVEASRFKTSPGRISRDQVARQFERG